MSRHFKLCFIIDDLIKTLFYYNCLGEKYGICWTLISSTLNKNAVPLSKTTASLEHTGVYA